MKQINHIAFFIRIEWISYCSSANSFKSHKKRNLLDGRQPSTSILCYIVRLLKWCCMLLAIERKQDDSVTRETKV